MSSALGIGKTTPLSQSANRVLLRNISWQTYEALVKELEAQPGIRLTYDRGQLEVMTPLIPHESNKKLIGRLVEALTEELSIEIRSLGSLTCKREDLARGLEPDQCYYIQNEQVVRGMQEIDFSQDPLPDLAIEIDITSSSINRMEIYADLGVPEVWRYDGKSLKIYILENKTYKECDASPTLPQLPPAEIVRFLELSKTMGETSWIRLFRQWVRSKIQQT
ncbi:MAG: Uma2 family endonuclease [Aphanothece sp. CMT-3BRIN-NPC111]|jgi:Uma2 family endonuclease|nr:Uma2 family endonuclease [Aphanothece sp. CMT-3BRIN-NPC111]